MMRPPDQDVVLPDGDEDLARTAPGVELIGGVLELRANGGAAFTTRSMRMRVTTQTAITQKDAAETSKSRLFQMLSRLHRPRRRPANQKPDLHALPPSEVRAGDVPEMSTSPGERAINTSTTIAQAAAIAQARAICGSPPVEYWLPQSIDEVKSSSVSTSTYFDVALASSCHSSSTRWGPPPAHSCAVVCQSLWTSRPGCLQKGSRVRGSISVARRRHIARSARDRRARCIGRCASRFPRTSRSARRPSRPTSTRWRRSRCVRR